MKFAFFGFDFFIDSIEVLLKHGWKMCYHHIPRVDESFYLSQRTRIISEDQRSTDLGHDLNIDAYSKIEQSDIDYLIVAGLSQKVLISRLGNLKAINIHPTYLPQGRGKWPFPYLISKNREAAGVTFHKISETFDSGDILIQKKVHVSDRDNYESVSAKLKIKSIEIAHDFANAADGLYENAFPQGRDYSYWNVPSWRTERIIDFSSNVNDIDCLVRSFGKFGTEARLTTKTLLVKDIATWTSSHTHTPGSIIIDGQNEILVAAKDGFVLIRVFEEIQRG